jgi:DNA-directed RNA polymerase I, II, and III subunit RPABC2
MSDEEYESESDEEMDEADPDPDEEEQVQEYCLEDQPDEPEVAINKTLQSNFMDIHPQERIINYEESNALCTVKRNEQGNIVDANHTSLPIITKYEYTRIIGIRASQIEKGAPLFIEVPDTMIDSYLIAKDELHQKKLPFIIKRPIPNGSIEYWKLVDLELLF